MIPEHYAVRVTIEVVGYKDKIKVEAEEEYTTSPAEMVDTTAAKAAGRAKGALFTL
jgi:hypothetical protein